MAATSNEHDTSFLARQGDVLIGDMHILGVGGDLVDGHPLPRDRHGRVVLAYGEVTGHAHALADRHVTLHALSDREVDDRFLSIVGAEATLQHEEHGSIVLQPGSYIVRRQREYTSADMRASMVAD